MMIGEFSKLGYPAHTVDTVEKGTEGDRPAQRAVRSLPSVEVPGSGIDFVIAQQGHPLTVYLRQRLLSTTMSRQIVVAGALIVGSALLVAQRRRPPELAGLWELPGGKVAPGETEAQALVRELREELGVEVGVLGRLGADVAVGETLTLRAYQVVQTGGTLHPHDHGALRWVQADELHDLPWVPADTAWLTALQELLAR